MSRKLALAALFTALFVPAAVSQWPAASLAGWVEDNSGGRWKLSGAEGTLWNGSATLLVTESGGASTSTQRWRVVQNVRWRWRWLEILQGRLAFDAGLEQGGALIAVSSGGVSVENLDTTLPASVLGGLLTGPLARYGWTGNLQARSAAFKCAWSGHACAGEVEILWSNAGISEISQTTLGSYRSRIIGEGQAVHFDLATLDGRLQIAGTGDVDSAGTRFTGEAYAQGAEADRLEAHLRTFGQRGGSAGKYVLDYRDGGKPR